jgi:thiamine-phosphate pyrophosphorylase
MFGEPDSTGECPAFAAVEERIGWWAEVFEIPCVGYSDSLATISPLVAAGADFVALCDAVWREPDSIAETIREAGRHLRLPEPAT